MSRGAYCNRQIVSSNQAGYSAGKWEGDTVVVSTLVLDERACFDEWGTPMSGDMRVEERAVSMAANVIPLMGRMYDQLAEQLNKIVDEVRRLPNYQINWPAVHEVMRDLLQQFQKLRRITNKCLGLVNNDEHRRIVRDLSEHIDRKIELCQSMGG